MNGLALIGIGSGPGFDSASETGGIGIGITKFQKVSKIGSIFAMLQCLKS